MTGISSDSTNRDVANGTVTECTYGTGESHFNGASIGTTRSPHTSGVNGTYSKLPSSENPLPDVRRIVTGHNESGQSIHVVDSRFPTQIIRANDRVVGYKVRRSSDHNSSRRLTDGEL